MYSKHFKLQVAATVFVSLLLGMFLIDLVVFLLLYQYQSHKNVVDVQRVLKSNVWVASDRDGFDHGRLQKAEEFIRMSLGSDIIEVYLLVTDHSKQVRDAVGTNLQKIVEDAERLNLEQVEYLEGLQLPFMFIPTKIAIAVPVSMGRASGLSISAVGITLSSKLWLQDLWQKQKIIAVYMLINAIILSTLIFFRMRRVLFDPVENLVHVAENYEVAEGGGLFPDSNENEFGQLSRAMNSMVKRIEKDRQKLFDTVASLEEANRQIKQAQDEVIRAEKLAAAGRLFAGLAHEVGNPVAIVQGYLELLEHDDIFPDDRKQFARRGIQELHRIDNLLSQLLDATRKSKGETEKVEINRLVNNIAEILEVSFEKKEIQLEIMLLSESLFAMGNREKFHQVLLNMLINAMDAVTGKNFEPFEGKVSIVVGTTKKSDKDYVFIDIKDNGSGIHDEDLSYIFEPFFTTKGPGKGTGLGLAVSYRIIQSYEGNIDVFSEVDKGTTFTITLPRISS